MIFKRLLSNRKLQTDFCYAVGPILGLVIFHILFDLGVYLNYFWGLDKPNDLMQHIAGFYALRSAPWRLPLLYTNILGYPEGVSVYFTDSIPLMALLFKLFAPVLPADFHFYKLWVLLAFLLQPVSAVYLIRAFGFRRFGAAFFAAAFSLLIKWLIFRTGHPALCGQFVLLFAIAFYVQQTRSDPAARNLRRMAVKWFILICVAFLIHLYLFVMVVGIFFAAVLDLRAPEVKRVSLLIYKLNLLLLPALLFLILYPLFISATSYTDLPPTEGYSYFSLNLTGPIYGGSLVRLPQSLGPTGGQVFEDQSYLGLGLILLAAMGLALNRKTLLPILRRHPFLLLLMLGFAIFALSTDVFLGKTLLYRYPSRLTARILASPVSQFRASARFFWPIGYLLLFFGLASVLKKRWALPVLACLLVIQWIDLPKPYSPRPEGYAQAYSADLPFWDALLQGKRSLYIYPTLSCGGDAYRFNIPVLMIAAKDSVTSNTVFVTRYQEDCEEKYAAAMADLSPKTVHIFAAPAGNSQAQQALQAFHSDWCAGRQELTICVPYPSARDRELLKQVNSLVLNNQSPLNYP